MVFGCRFYTPAGLTDNSLPRKKDFVSRLVLRRINRFYRLVTHDPPLDATDMSPVAARLMPRIQLGAK
jgi:hypothetical protein